MKNIAFLFIAGTLVYAGTASAHPTHATQGHHHHIHHHAERVAAGKTTPEEAVEVIVKDQDFKGRMADDIKIHADQIKASGRAS